MWNWLGQLAKGFAEAILNKVFERVDQPSEIKDANTPKSTRNRWRKFLRKRVHESPSNSNR